MHEIRWFPVHRQPALCMSAGDELLPLSSLPGWERHSRRLNHSLASIRRSAAGMASIIGISPMLDGVYCSIAYTPAASPASADRFIHALGAFRSRCLRTCQVCGQPAKPLVAGGVRCAEHEHPMFRSEVVFDPRQITRQRRVWMASIGAKLTGRMTKHGRWKAIPVYSHAQTRYVRTQDAPPGQRQMFFEALVEDGLRPEELGGCWVFRIPGAHHE